MRGLPQCALSKRTQWPGRVIINSRGRHCCCLACLDLGRKENPQGTSFEFADLTPNSAWANGSLAEVAGQLGKMVEHPDQDQPNPGPRANGTPCTVLSVNFCSNLHAVGVVTAD